MKKVLVTGATGFLGSHVLPILQLHDFQVHTVGRRGTVHSASQIRHHVCDLMQPEAARDVVRKIRPTHLLHLAWCADAGSFWNSPDNLKWLSVTEALCESLAEFGGVRAVGIGSCAEYDWSRGSTFTEFDCHGTPTTLYGQTKREAGERLSALAKSTQVSAAWGRLFFVYGPGGHPQRVPGAMITSLINNEVTPCPAGTQWRDYIYIRDAATATVRLLESTVNGPVNIATGQPVQVVELITAASIASGNPQLLRIGEVPSQSTNNPDRIVANIDRLVGEVGFRPIVSLEVGMAETVAWWQRHQKSRAA